MYKILFFGTFLDFSIPLGNNIDGACGLYYKGDQSEKKIQIKELLEFYKE
jgi:hypothetical protein